MKIAPVIAASLGLLAGAALAQTSGTSGTSGVGSGTLDGATVVDNTGLISPTAGNIPALSTGGADAFRGTGATGDLTITTLGGPIAGLILHHVTREIEADRERRRGN